MPDPYERLVRLVLARCLPTLETQLGGLLCGSARLRLRNVGDALLQSSVPMRPLLRKF